MSDDRRMTEPGNPPVKRPDEPEHWLVRADTIRNLWIGSSIILAFMVAGDFFVEHYEHFGVDGGFGFYAWYGFGTCVLMVVGAKLLGVFLKRGDVYYERRVGALDEGGGVEVHGADGPSGPYHGGDR